MAAARQDAMTGVLARLWRAVADHDAPQVLAVSEQVATLSCSGPLAAALRLTIENCRTQVASEILTDAVASVAGETEPKPGLSELMRGDASQTAQLAHALSGVEPMSGPVSDADCADLTASLLEVVQAQALDPEGIWRLYDAGASLSDEGSGLSAAIRLQLLDQLASTVGLDTPSA